MKPKSRAGARSGWIKHGALKPSAMGLRLSPLLCGLLILAAPAGANPPAAGVPIPGIPTRDILLGTLDPARDKVRDSSLKPLEIDVECALTSLSQGRGPGRIGTTEQPRNPQTPQAQQKGDETNSERPDLDAPVCSPAQGTSDEAAPQSGR